MGLAWLNAAVMVALLGLLTAILLVASANLFLAKKAALKCGNAKAWFGTLEVAAWDPTEGVLLLKDKMLEYVDSNPNDGGGVRVVLPFLGEDEVCRVPLEVQTLQYWDERVLSTGESIAVGVGGRLW